MFCGTCGTEWGVLWSLVENKVYRLRKIFDSVMYNGVTKVFDLKSFSHGQAKVDTEVLEHTLDSV
jgi:hypothetical protein